MIYNVVSISAVWQSDSMIHIHIVFCIFFSIIVYSWILNIVPCAIQQDVVVYSFYVNIPPPWQEVCSLYLWVYFYIVDISTTFPSLERVPHVEYVLWGAVAQLPMVTLSGIPGLSPAWAVCPLLWLGCDCCRHASVLDWSAAARAFWWGTDAVQDHSPGGIGLISWCRNYLEECCGWPVLPPKWDEVQGTLEGQLV